MSVTIDFPKHKAVKMKFKHLFLIGIILLAYHIIEITSKIDLVNLKCIPLDKSFSDFENCRIKSVNRTYKYFSLKVKLFKVPVTNISIRVSLLKRFNTFKPFLYNISFDACRFLASKRRNALYSEFYALINHHSNMNHTCPYDHDLIVDRITVDFLNNQFVNILPIPKGDYVLSSSWYAYGINRADVHIYINMS